MIHPEYEVISSDHALKDKKLTPVYRVPKGIGQKKIRGFIHAAISKLDFAEDFLDVEKYDSSLNMKIIDALATIHNPDAGINIEEMLPGGAQQMIKEGVLENPKVNVIIGQHVFPDLEKGKVGFRLGKYMASTDELHITVKGKGGHAALPEKYNNPILGAAKLIIELDMCFKKYKDKVILSCLADER